MPLIHSASNKARSANIAEMMRSGYPQRQAVAASYNNQRRYRASGGANIDFSKYVADVPVTGNSPYVMPIGANGMPTGSVPQAGLSGGFPSRIAAQSSVPAPGMTAGAGLSTATADPKNMDGIGGGYYGLMNGSNYVPLGTNAGGINYLTGASPNNASWQGIGKAPQGSITPKSNFFTYDGIGSGPDPSTVPTSTTPYSGKVYTMNNGAYSLFNDQAAKRGGKIPQFANGGIPTSSEMAPWYAKREAADQFHAGGLFGGNHPGRADTLPVSVAADSHIVPADVVAGLGEGNTLSGARVLDKIFHSGPYGMKLKSGHASLHIPHAARGGRHEGKGTVPIAASSGEYNVSPEAVRRIGGGDIKRGHDIIDAFIVKVRKRTIDKMKKLKPPVGMKK